MCCFCLHFSDSVLKKTCCSLLLKKITCLAKREKKITCREEKCQPPPPPLDIKWSVLYKRPRVSPSTTLGLSTLNAQNPIRGGPFGSYGFFYDQTFISTHSLRVQFFSELIKSKQFLSQQPNTEQFFHYLFHLILRKPF